MIRNPIRKLLARMVRRPTEPSRNSETVEPTGLWLLITGAWEDPGEWDDASTWNDGA